VETEPKAEAIRRSVAKHGLHGRAWPEATLRSIGSEIVQMGTDTCVARLISNKLQPKYETVIWYTKAERTE